MPRFTYRVPPKLTIEAPDQATAMAFTGGLVSAARRLGSPEDSVSDRTQRELALKHPDSRLVTVRHTPPILAPDFR